MTYKGKEIIKPTLEMVQEYILRENFTFPAQAAYNHFEKELWQTRNGQPFRSLETALNSYNGGFIYRQQRNSGFVSSLF